MYLFFLLLVIGSCVALKPLKMQRVDNLTNRIRTDGIFVSNNNRRREDCGVYIFYTNGVMLSFENRRKSNECIDYWTEHLNKNYNYKEVPYWWGIYQLTNDSISFERWLSTDYYYPTISYTGQVINDTVIIVNYESSILDTFRFVEFSPKPDSTNRFIK